jgi:hypothetical protein
MQALSPLRLVLLAIVFLTGSIWPSAQAQISTVAPTAPQIVIPRGVTPPLEMDCPSASAIGFDSKNNPYLLDLRDPADYGNIHYLDKGVWKVKSVLDDLQKSGITEMKAEVPPNYGATAAIEFDAQDGMYILLPSLAPSTEAGAHGLTAFGNTLLLYAPHFGVPFQVIKLGTRPYLTSLESRAGGNDLSQPPAIIYGKKSPAAPVSIAPVPGEKGAEGVGKFLERVSISIVFPHLVNGQLEVKNPVLITDKGDGVEQHSGSFNIAATSGDSTFVAYMEVPDDIATGGNPSWIAQIDRTQNRLMGKDLITVAPPKNTDVHAVPNLAIDSKKILHYVTGSHGWQPEQPGFFYARSTGPAEISQWTTPVLIGHGQSYSGLLMNPDDSMTLIERIHPALCFQNYDPTSQTWSSPRTLASSEKLPPSGLYSCFYHKGFVDRTGTEYVQFTLYVDGKDPASGKTFHEYGPHLLAVSEDEGKTWQLATTAIFMKHLK